MTALCNLAVATALRADGATKCAADGLSAAGSGHGGGWIWAYLACVGRRHLARGGVCEDAVGVELCDDSAQSGIHLALADGVSGGACGDVAASALVSHCLSWRSDAGGNLDQWIGKDAEAVVRGALSQHTTRPGAATLAAAWLNADGTGIVNRIGDCRLYLLLPHAACDALRVELLMPDQTMAYMGYDENVGTRARQPAHMVGNGSAGVPELLPITVPPGTGLLLCSDGLHEVLTVEDLETAWAVVLGTRALGRNPTPIEATCATLVGRAQEMGSDDDVSALVAFRIPTASG